MTELVRDSEGRLDFVELGADVDIRLDREGTPLAGAQAQRARRPSARQWFLDAEAHQTSTSGGFCYPDQHVRLDNSQLEPADAAIRITEHLGLR